MKPIDLAAYGRWESPVLLVAEAGVNHEGDLGTALEMVDAAAAAGVDAIKFQVYRAEALATRTSRAYWDRSLEPAESQYELFKRYDVFGRAEYERVAAACDDAGIAFLTTPFDLEAVAWLDPLQSFWKIASGDITNDPLLERVAETGKPVLLSTGASTLDEVARAVAVLQKHGCEQLALLHCTLSYPTASQDAALGAIPVLAEMFPGVVCGYSDHTVPPVSFAAIEAAVALGARVVEKHYTLDKSLRGNDHYHAFEPADFGQLRERLTQLGVLLGRRAKTVLPAEEAARTGARRSVVARERIPAGTPLGLELLTVKRPGGGIEPRHLGELAHRRAARDIEADTTLEWSMVEGGSPPGAGG